MILSELSYIISSKRTGGHYSWLGETIKDSVKFI